MCPNLVLSRVLDGSQRWLGRGRGSGISSQLHAPSSGIELWPVRSALSEEYLVLSLDSTNLSVRNGSNAW